MNTSMCLSKLWPSQKSFIVKPVLYNWVQVQLGNNMKKLNAAYL